MPTTQAAAGDTRRVGGLAESPSSRQVELWGKRKRSGVERLLDGAEAALRGAKIGLDALPNGHRVARMATPPKPEKLAIVTPPPVVDPESYYP